MRTRDERRKNDFKKALHKMKKDHSTNDTPYYDNIHQYSKNKIHCSCPKCANKYNKHDKHSKKTKTYLNQEIENFLKYDIA
jgi:Mn-containing catalase